MKAPKIKSVLFTEKNKVALEDTDFDWQCGPDEIIVKTLVSLISPGTELAWLQGLTAWVKYPFNSGYANVGEIISAGNKVAELKKGDIVFTQGPHTSHIKWNTREQTVAVLPVSLDPVLAAFAIFADIAVTALRSGRVELGDRVAVLGLGPVGNLAAQLLQLNGCEVVGIDLSRQRIELARQCGIRFCINAAEEDMLQVIQVWTKGRGCETVVEASGNSQAALTACNIVRENGEILLLGTPRKPLETDITGFLFDVHIKNLTIKSAFAPCYPVKENRMGLNKHSIERNAGIMLKYLAEDRLIVKPLLTDLYQPENCAEAYRNLLNMPDKYITIAFDWRETNANR